MSLMAAEDLKEFAGVSTTTVICRQRLVLRAAGSELIRWALEGTFGGVEELALHDGVKVEDGRPVAGDWEAEEERVTRRFRVMGVVTLTYRAGGELEVEWVGDLVNDGIADAVMAVLFSVESSPAAIKRESIHPFEPTTLLHYRTTANPSILHPQTLHEPHTPTPTPTPRVTTTRSRRTPTAPRLQTPTPSTTPPHASPGSCCSSKRNSAPP